MDALTWCILKNPYHNGSQKMRNPRYRYPNDIMKKKEKKRKEKEWIRVQHWCAPHHWPWLDETIFLSMLGSWLPGLLESYNNRSDYWVLFLSNYLRPLLPSCECLPDVLDALVPSILSLQKSTLKDIQDFWVGTWCFWQHLWWIHGGTSLTSPRLI
jgi:hypothetical protein